MARPYAYKLEGRFLGRIAGRTVYYHGFKARPGFLPKSGGGFPLLKHLMEILDDKYKDFTLTFTPKEDSVAKDGKRHKIRLSETTIKRVGKLKYTEGRELNLRLAKEALALALPADFSGYAPKTIYKSGLIASVLPNLDPRRLSDADRKALTTYAVDVLAEDPTHGADIETAYHKKQDVQLVYMKRLLAEFENRIGKSQDESAWQKYFSDNILFFQDSYIQRLEKLNVAVVGTSFPDFWVVTSDGYLDIIEIKKPDTTLVREDTSRHNFYWSPDVAKAISQTENYIDSVMTHKDTIRTTIADKYGISLRIIKPRGLVIAGRSSDLGDATKKADDFRRLNEGLKNVTIIPYDELARRLRNTIVSIERLAGRESGKRVSKAANKKKR